MVDLTGERKIITEEETEFRGAISEALLQKFGKTNNFIALYQHSEKKWVVNGALSLLTVPYTASDGLEFFQYDAEIIDAWAFMSVQGTSGTAEFDIKKAAAGGSFASIFSTTPKIAYNANVAGGFAWCHVGSAFANTTAPVLSTTEVDAGDAVRMDIIQMQADVTRGAGGIVLHYRPR